MYLPFDLLLLILSKIHKLQQKKLELAHEFIDANNYFDYFSEDNIVDLFD